MKRLLSVCFALILTFALFTAAYAEGVDNTLDETAEEQEIISGMIEPEVSESEDLALTGDSASTDVQSSEVSAVEDRAVSAPMPKAGNCAHNKYSKVNGGYKRYKQINRKKHSVTIYTPEDASVSGVTCYFVKCDACGETGFYRHDESDQSITWESEGEAFYKAYSPICSEANRWQAHTFVNGKCSKCGSTGRDTTTVKLSAKSVTLGQKETIKLSATVKPTGKAKSLLYKSSNTSVAVVDAKTGKITAKKPGKATIKAIIDFETRATCKVTVKKAPKTITLNKSQVTLEKGKSCQLKATLPKGTYTRKLTWSSSNVKVAKVSSKGKVTAVGQGTATITVKTAGGVKAICKVTVMAPKKRLELSQFFGVNFSIVEKELGIKAGMNNGKIQLGSWGEPAGPDYVELIEISNDPKGEYMIYGVYLGMKLSEADKLLRSRGWYIQDYSDNYINEKDGRYRSLMIRTNGNNKISYLFGELYGAGI